MHAACDCACTLCGRPHVRMPLAALRRAAGTCACQRQARLQVSQQRAPRALAVRHKASIVCESQRPGPMARCGKKRELLCGWILVWPLTL